MGKLKRVLLWVAAVPLSILELLYLLELLRGDRSFLFSFLVFGIPLFFIIRVLRADRPAQPEEPARRQTPAPEPHQVHSEEPVRPQVPAPEPRRAGPAFVTYRALSQENALQVQDYVVVDVETTGLDPAKDEIIEVAGIRCVGGNLEAFNTFVFPRHRIPKEVTELTGIRNSDVWRAPQIKEVAPKILAFIKGLPIVAHNAPFDVKFLAAAFEKINADVDMRYIDTVNLARAAFPGLRNYKLATLIGELGLISGGQEHRAGSDTRATMKLFELCRETIPRREAEEARRHEREQRDEKAYHLNQYGMQAEADGNVEKAIGYYEDILEDKTALPNAYMRLAVIYKKQHRWEDVVRVCDAALAVLPGHAGKWCQPEEWEKRKAYAVTKLGTKTAAPSDG